MTYDTKKTGSYELVSLDTRILLRVVLHGHIFLHQYLRTAIFTCFLNISVLHGCCPMLILLFLVKLECYTDEILGQQRKYFGWPPKNRSWFDINFFSCRISFQKKSSTKKKFTYVPKECLLHGQYWTASREIIMLGKLAATPTLSLIVH